jgi:hypothetical protein
MEVRVRVAREREYWVKHSIMRVRVGEILGKKKYVLPNIPLHPQICFTQYSPHSHPPPPSMFYPIFPSIPKYVLPNISPHPHTHFMFYSIIPTTPTDAGASLTSTRSRITQRMGIFLKSQR